MVKLTENDIKKIIHDVVFHLHKTVDNPLCIDNYFRNNPLMEGYFKTYPPEKIEYYNKLVKDKMNLNDAVLKSNYFANK